MTGPVGWSSCSLHKDATPAAFVPPCLWAAATCLSQLRAGWRWLRTFSLCQHPHHFLPLAGGYLLEKTIGDYFFLQLAAQVMLVSQRILTCLEARRQLTEQCGKWRELCLKWPEPAFIQFYEHIVKIVKLSGKILLSGLIFTMHALDAIEALSWTATAQKEGAQEFFLNTKLCLQTLLHNKAQLLQNLKEQRLLIEVLLQPTGVSFDSLHNGVKSCVETVETIQDTAHKTSLFGQALLLVSQQGVSSAQAAWNDLLTNPLG